MNRVRIFWDMDRHPAEAECTKDPSLSDACQGWFGSGTHEKRKGFRDIPAISGKREIPIGRHYTVLKKRICLMKNLEKVAIVTGARLRLPFCVRDTPLPWPGGGRSNCI
jgi:hypothetical protein